MTVGCAGAGTSCSSRCGESRGGGGGQRRVGEGNSEGELAGTICISEGMMHMGFGASFTKGPTFIIL